MKKNKMMRLASFLLVATLLTTTMISGTFAKYTSSATGEATANVAAWSFEVNNTNIATDPATTFTIDVFETINDTKAPGGDETDVVDNKIAPGTTGSFDIVLENTSEVTAAYTIDYTVANDGVPLVYKVGGAVLDDVTVPVVLAAGDSRTITVNWEWPYEGGTVELDMADTQLGIDADAAPTVTAKITATQVD